MAFPTKPTTGANTLIASTQASATTTHTFASLTTLDNASGDLLIAVIVLYQASATGNAFGSWGGGFTEFTGGDSSSATNPSMAMGCAYKISDGTETGTFTVTSTISGRSAMFLMSVKNWHGTTPPEVAFSGATTATAPDPPSLDPSWSASAEDILYIAVAAAGQTSLTGTWTGLSAAPTNYTDYAMTAIAGGDVIGAAQAAVGFRQLNGTSDNPGAFTTDTSPEIERAATIAVRPSLTQTISNVTGPTVTVTPGTPNLAYTQSFTPSGPTVTATAGTPALALSVAPVGPTVSVTPATAEVAAEDTTCYLALEDNTALLTEDGADFLTEDCVVEEQPVDPVGPTVTVTAGTPSFNVYQAVAPTGPTITATPGVPSLNVFQAVGPTAPTVTITAGTPAFTLALTLTGPTVTVTPGTASVLAGQAITPVGPTVTVTPGVPAFAPGPVTITADGVSITVTAGTAFVDHEVEACYLALEAGGALLLEDGTEVLTEDCETEGEQSITATPPTVTVTAGTATVAQQAAQTITPTGATVTITPGVGTVTPGAVTITLTGPTVSITPGTPSLRLAITPTAPTVTVTPGTPALRQSIVPTGPTVTVTPGSASVLNAGAQVIEVVGPIITVVPGTATVTGGEAPVVEVPRPGGTGARDVYARTVFDRTDTLLEQLLREEEEILVLI